MNNKLHPHMRPGAIVALTSIPAWSQSASRHCYVSGLYEIVEHESRDLSAGIRDDTTTLIPAGTPDDAPIVDDAFLIVGTDDLFEQACPIETGRRIAEEYHMEAFS